MLFVLYTDPARVRFTEYIPQFLVRASSAAKARQLAIKAYPNHPLNLMSEDVVAAAVGELRQACSESVPYFVYVASEDRTPETAQRVLGQVLGPLFEPQLPVDLASWHLAEVPVGGRAGVIARVENLTPRVSCTDLDKLMLVWRAVPDHWPHRPEEPVPPPMGVDRQGMPVKASEPGAWVDGLQDLLTAAEVPSDAAPSA